MTPLEADIKRMVGEGKNATEISKALDIAIVTVQRKKRKLGLTNPGSEVGKWVEEHPEVKRAFSTLSPRTRKQYYAYLRVYSLWVGKEPGELWKEPWETIRDRITDFRLHLEEEGKAPNTLNSYTTCIRRFYEYNNIIFKGKFFSNGKGARAKEENEKELITPQRLKEILDISTPIEKAMFIAQLQSGLGANELCNLKVKDVGEVENGEVKLRIEDGLIKLKLVREKTGVKFTTFLGHDSLEALKKWIEIRQGGKVLLDRKLSEGAKIRNNNDFLFISYAKKEKRWGGITPITYAKYLRNRVRQLGWISDENLQARGLLSVFRPHALRMSFSEIMKHQAFVNWDFVECMLGHKFSGTDSAYVKFDDTALKRAYKEAEPFLSLTPMETIVSDDKYQELKKENELLKQRYEEQAGKIKALEAERKNTPKPPQGKGGDP